MTYIATRRAAQSRLWTPNDLGSGLSLWLDGLDKSTIVPSGSKVAQWRDKSAYGNHVAQASSGNQPLNLSPPAVQNSSGYLSNSSPIGMPLGTSDRTLVIASSEYSGRNATEHIFSYGGVATNGSFGIGNYSEGGDASGGDSASENYQIYNGSGVYGPLHSILAIYNTLQITTLTASNQNIYVSKNGANVYSGSMPYNTVSGPISLFNDSGLGNAFQGSIFAVLLCNSADATIVARMEGFVAWAIGVANILATRHAYRQQPPRIAA